MSTVADNHISTNCTLTHVLLNNGMRHNDQASIHTLEKKKKISNKLRDISNQIHGI